jgi:type I restriction enzyme, S subunit
MYRRSSSLSDSREAVVDGIKAAKFRGLPIPFPSHDEQKEIVRRIESLFLLADRLEARLSAARLHVDAIPTSLLARAFRGELVSTEAARAEAERRTFESAAELLGRIQHDHETERSPEKSATPINRKLATRR